METVGGGVERCKVELDGRKLMGFATKPSNELQHEVFV